MRGRRREDSPRDARRNRSRSRDRPSRRRESPRRRSPDDRSLERGRRGESDRYRREEPKRRRDDEYPTQRREREVSQERSRGDRRDDRREDRREDRRDDRRDDRREDRRDDRRDGSYRGVSRGSRSIPAVHEETRSSVVEVKSSGLAATAPPAFPDSRTVWIGSVPETVTEEDVFDVMTDLAGDISGLRIVKTRGFGYVRFVALESAQKLLASVARTPIVLHNRRIRVDACEDMPTLLHPYRPAANSKPPNCTTLFVGNLPPETNEGELENFFASQLESAIPVQSVSLRRGGYKGMSFAHVRFETSEQCEQAAVVAGGRLRGSRIRVDWALDKGGMAEGGPKITQELRGKTNKLYIGGLNDGIEEADVVDALSQFGQVLSFKIHRDKFGVRSFGYIMFGTPEMAAAAVDNIGSVSVKDAKIRADFARPERGPAVQQMDVEMIQPARARSASPDVPRVTPVSYSVPEGYGPMRTWEQCYAKNLPNSV